MSFEINLSPEDIERLVKDSIMRAGFGKAIETAIARIMSSTYDNPIEKQLKEYVSQVASTLIKEHYGKAITEAVRAHIEKLVTVEVVEKTTSAAVQKMVQAAQERSY